MNIEFTKSISKEDKRLIRKIIKTNKFNNTKNRSEFYKIDELRFLFNIHHSHFEDKNRTNKRFFYTICNNTIYIIMVCNNHIFLQFNAFKLIRQFRSHWKTVDYGEVFQIPQNIKKFFLIDHKNHGIAEYTQQCESFVEYRDSEDNITGHLNKSNGKQVTSGLVSVCTLQEGIPLHHRILYASRSWLFYQVFNDASHLYNDIVYHKVKNIEKYANCLKSVIDDSLPIINEITIHNSYISVISQNPICHISQSKLKLKKNIL